MYILGCLTSIVTLQNIGSSRNRIDSILNENSDLHPVTDILEAEKYSKWSLEGNGTYEGNSTLAQRLVLKK